MAQSKAKRSRTSTSAGGGSAGDDHRKRSNRGSTAGYDRKREELIGLAVEVFSHQGYVGGTTSEIARLAGLTQPALYYYVGAKHAFLEEICSTVGGKLRAAMDEVLAADIGARDRLHAFLRAYTSIVLAERDAFRIYVTEASHLPRAARERLREDERRYQENITTIVEEAIASGDLPPVAKPWLLAQMLVGAMSWPYRWYRGQVDPEEMADALMELVTGRG